MGGLVDGNDLESLLACIDARDRYTGQHCWRVGELVYEMALSALPDEGDWAARLLVAGKLHDIGKIGTPIAVLTKVGPLTQVESALMRMHPVTGEDILRPLFAEDPHGPEMLAAVRHHHERWDGGGYPDHLKGCQIPRAARLLAVADAVDAMTSDRPYRRALSPGQTREALRLGAGSQWAPDAVAAYLSLSRRRPGATAAA